MAVEVTTAIFIANLLHACVPGALWVLLPALAYFTLAPSGNAYATAAGYISKAMLMILSFYALLGAMTGFMLLTRLDNIATIIGADLEPIVEAIEAFHGAIDVDIPDMVNNFAIRDVHAFMLIPMIGFISIMLSYWFATSLPIMLGQCAFLVATHGVPGYFIMRAFRIDHVVFWSIVGFVSVLLHVMINLGYSRVSWTFKHWPVWLPVIFFVLVRVGLWCTFILSNPITSAIPLVATEWIYPGFVTVEILGYLIMIYFTVETRMPADGWSFDAIFYGTLVHFDDYGNDLPTKAKMPAGGAASKMLGRNLE